jgi:hypothetical protein
MPDGGNRNDDAKHATKLGRSISNLRASFGLEVSKPARAIKFHTRTEPEPKIASPLTVWTRKESLYNDADKNNFAPARHAVNSVWS